jgi:nucleoid DNA-binding protein
MRKNNSSTLIQRPVHKIVKEIAAERGLTMAETTSIVQSEFHFVVDQMRKGQRGDASTFGTILLKYFGTFQFAKNKHTAIGKLIETNTEKRRLLELQEEELNG